LTGSSAKLRRQQIPSHAGSGQRRANGGSDELAKLVALPDSGVLTEDEFGEQKARLLKGS